ncbi:MAG: hypothetical protein KGQ59_05450, partial [Bdellovibrionales bacterium]|nr:hypothetical protein [Bdellovibrionales bacterium]
TGGTQQNFCASQTSAMLNTIQQSLENKRLSLSTLYLLMESEPDESSIEVIRYPGGDTSKPIVISKSETNGWSYAGRIENEARVVNDTGVAMNRATGWAVRLNGSARLTGKDTAWVIYKPQQTACYPANQPVPFVATNAYLSGIQMCTPGTSLSCPSDSGSVSMGGTGATSGYFTDVDVDDRQSVRMDIIPYSSAWAPNRTVAPMTATARGSFQMGPTMLAYLQSKNGGVLPCVSRVVALSTGFDPYPGSAAGRTTLFSTKIVIQWQGNAGSGTDELSF